jgi:hypothetical protein
MRVQLAEQLATARMEAFQAMVTKPVAVQVVRD